MQTIEQRIAQAKVLWNQGSDAETAGDYPLAYALYTQAHDQVIDCASFHQHAHERLRVVNWKLGHYGELITDWLLHAFAPLGVFALVSYFAKSGTFGADLCKQST
jgi:hypothetical protein